MRSVYISDDLAVASVGDYAIHTNAAVSGPSSGSSAQSGGASPTSPVEKVAGAGEIALWGDNNDFPTLVRKDVEESTILATTLEWKARAWYGGGLVYGILKGYDESGKEIISREKLPEVDAFLHRSRRYAYEVLLNMSYFANAFPELIPTKDRSKIRSLCDQDAEFCRYSKPDSKGVVKNVYINANWANGGKVGDGFTTTVGVIDPYFETADMVRARDEEYKYIYPISIPSPGKTIYQLASWNSIRRSERLPMLKKIPNFKSKFIDNQLSIKYVVNIHQKYWEWKYGDWEEKSLEDRKRIISDELKAFNDIMTGVDGAGKSIMATTMRIGNEDVPTFTVTAIDDKVKSGLYVEDSQEAASHVYTAAGVAPTLMGISPGKGMGAGSGSDARVAFNNFISTSKFVQDLALEPLHFVRDFNGWNPDLRFQFLNPMIMTLDKGKAVQQETA